MAAERVPMRKLREIIRLKLQLGLSGRAIARSCNLSPSTASDYLARIALAKVTWPLPPALDDDATLEALLFPDEHAPVASRPEPDWAWVHGELRRKHVTKMLLWQEYREAQPGGYQYSAFCERYLRWARPLTATMRQEHRAGEKCFLDFSGDGIDVVDPITGECAVAKLFVAVLGGSSLTYLKRLGLRHRRGHDLRRTFITLARVDCARKVLLEIITHSQRGNIIDIYTSMPWASLCE